LGQPLATSAEAFGKCSLIAPPRLAN